MVHCPRRSAVAGRSTGRGRWAAVPEAEGVARCLPCPKHLGTEGVVEGAEDGPSCCPFPPRAAGTWVVGEAAPGRAGSHPAGHFDTWRAAALKTERAGRATPAWCVGASERGCSVAGGSATHGGRVAGVTARRRGEARCGVKWSDGGRRVGGTEGRGGHGGRGAVVDELM